MSMTRTHSDALAAALAPSSGGWVREGRQRWSKDGAQCFLEEDWLGFDQPVAPLPARGWALLACNAALPPGLKLCCADPRVGTRLRGEMPLALEHDAAGLLARWLDGAAALPTLAAGSTAEPRLSSDPLPESLVSLVRESGWCFDTGDVPLEVAGPSEPARLSLADDGRLRIAFDLTPDPPCSPRSARAQAHLLLRVGAAVRMVRPAATAQPGARFAPRLEVWLPQPLLAETIAHALRALSVASDLCRAEFALLGASDPIAQRYLALQCGVECGGESDARESGEAISS